jgi:antitoxin (DNA-binding transcriptional repressor) of toxin-antitoxin stability system
MPRVFSVDEFSKRAREFIEAVEKGGDTVIVQDGGNPVAILTSHESAVAMASMVDLPRWEEWIAQMRETFPEAAARLGKMRERARESPEVDKALLGFNPSAGIVGSDAGREFLAVELRRLGVPITDESLLATVYLAVIDLCEDKERIFEEDLRVVAQELIAEAPQRLRLLSLTVSSSTGLPATAEVTLELGQGPAMRREHGDGPLDAAFNAIEKLTGLRAEVENFSVIAATKGRDAMAEAMIELSLAGTTVVGAGASTNAIEAGVHAYLNALNFLVEAGATETTAGAST